jgi:hypothetical protein
MAALSTPEAVATLWRTPTSEAETARIAFLLTFASAIVRKRLPSIDSWIADETVDADLVSAVVAGIVARAMRGWTPDNIRQVTIDDYSETRDTSAHEVDVTDEDLALITPDLAPAGAYTIQPGRSVCP